MNLLLLAVMCCVSAAAAADEYMLLNEQWAMSDTAILLSQVYLFVHGEYSSDYTQKGRKGIIACKARILF